MQPGQCSAASIRLTERPCDRNARDLQRPVPELCTVMFRAVLEVR